MKKYLMVLWAVLLLVPMAAGCKHSKGDDGSGTMDPARQAFLNDHVHFDFDRYNIRPDAAMVCQAKADFMNTNKGIQAEIQGHTDDRGTEVYNMALGDRRARATHNYMVKLGIDGSRMSAVSYGEERPIDPAQNEAAWAKNRRAQFVINAE